MKILIIGSNGFIGSHCVAHYTSKGFNVWVANLNEPTNSRSFKIERKNSDFSSVFQMQKFDVCINASGSANVGFSFENPSKDFELNVINVQKILIAIRDYNPKCKFINFSSAAVYGNPQTLPINENAVCKPLSPYGFHKLQSELLLAEYHKFFHLNTCSLRVFSAYGPRLKKQLFWDLYKKASQNHTVSLFGTGAETRDFIYIDDLMQIIDLVIEHSTFEGTVYNVASGIETKIAEAAALFINAYAPDKQILFSGETKVGDPNNWQADMEILKSYGYSANYSLNEGLKKYVKWLKENE